MATGGLRQDRELVGLCGSICPAVGPAEGPWPRQDRVWDEESNAAVPVRLRTGCGCTLGVKTPPCLGTEGL